MKRARAILAGLLIFGLLFAFLLTPAVSVAQDEDGEVGLFCNPPLERLAEAMKVPCDDLVELRAQGSGIGQIMKAWHMSQSVDEDWRSLLETKQSGMGWGQIKSAYRFADGDAGRAEELFALKQEGLGWGQIMHAQALSAAGLVDLDTAIGMMKEGLGWGDIRQQLELPPGPPPWAGGGKVKIKAIPPGQAKKSQGEGGEGTDSDG